MGAEGDRAAMGSLPRALGEFPALATLTPLRRRWAPALAGVAPPGAAPHIALTFDDGPDPATTPAFLEKLAQHGCHATFFLLGDWAERNLPLVEQMAHAGHELGVHGWTHRAAPLQRPSELTAGVRRTAELLRDTIAAPVIWYRPPYGVLSRTALRAAYDNALTPVLWSAWGRDWERRAHPDRVVVTVERRLTARGTVLLHDTDRTSAPGSWRTTLSATDTLLSRWSARGWTVGPLREHGLAELRG